MKLINLSKIALGVTALSLSTSLWAGSLENVVWDPIEGTIYGTAKAIENIDTLGVRHAMSGPEYIVTDKTTSQLFRWRSRP